MAPDRLRGQGSIQSDIYSLGIVIYEMITGKLPFADCPLRLESSPPRPTQLAPELPTEFDAIVLRAFENNVEARYATTADLLSDLNRLRARLNLLPARLAHLSEMSDGRHLCDDSETDQRVAVRLVNSAASLTELAEQCNRLETLVLANVGIPLRHFSNELFVGGVSPVPEGPNLRERFFGPTRQSLEKTEELRKIMASIANLLAVMHRAGLCHGLVSPMAITIGDGTYRLHRTICLTGSVSLSRNSAKSTRRIGGLPCPTNSIFTNGRSWRTFPTLVGGASTGRSFSRLSTVAELSAVSRMQLPALAYLKIGTRSATQR